MSLHYLKFAILLRENKSMENTSLKVVSIM